MSSLDFHFCDLVQSEWPFSTEYHLVKYDLAFLNRSEQVHFPQNDEKTTQIISQIVIAKGKGQNEFRRQMEIERGSLSRALPSSVGLVSL